MGFFIFAVPYESRCDGRRILVRAADYTRGALMLPRKADLTPALQLAATDPAMGCTAAGAKARTAKLESQCAALRKPTRRKCRA